MQAATRSRSEDLGLSTVRGDPSQHGREVGSLGQDGRPLDHGASRGVRAREARDQRADRVVVGAPLGPRIRRGGRGFGRRGR